jgi:hypothetical protein
MSAITKYYKLTSKFLVDYNAEIAVKLKEVLELSDEQYDKLVETLKVEDFLDFRKMTKRGGAKGGTTRAPTAYNLFVQQKIKELKLANPLTDRKDLMIQAAAAWTEEKKKKLSASTTPAATKTVTKKAKK